MDLQQDNKLQKTDTKKSVSTKSAANQMRKQYGQTFVNRCKDCCNMQKACRTDAKMICIAYDRETLWDGMEQACGLYNTPFLSLRPKHMPLRDYLETHTKRKLGKTDTDQQTAIF